MAGQVASGRGVCPPGFEEINLTGKTQSWYERTDMPPVEASEGGIRFFVEFIGGHDRAYLHLDDSGKLLSYYHYNGYDTAMEILCAAPVAESMRDRLLDIAESLPHLGISSVQVGQ